MKTLEANHLEAALDAATLPAHYRTPAKYDVATEEEAEMLDAERQAYEDGCRYCGGRLCPHCC